MNEAVDFFRKLLDTTDWPPRWHCGKWTQFHGWLYIISDLLIWSAYFAIPLIILKFVSRKAKARFIRAYFLFAAFILACGSTHLLDAITFWFPAYRLNALVRFFTGVVSWATVFYMIRIMPEAMTLKTNDELEREVAEREKAESDLRIANQQLLVAQTIANMGHWHWDVKSDTISWSEKLYQIFGVPSGEKLDYQQYLNRIHPDDRQKVHEMIMNVQKEKTFVPFYHRVLLPDGSERIVLANGEVALNSENEITSLLGTAQDVTDQQKAQQALVEKTYALETTNQELQRFAYVASHDLKEPLRKIMTFASLLQQEQQQQMAPKEKLYVEKIVQSATRMQQLIEDILHFSSVREDRQRFQKVSLQEMLHQVLTDMEVQISLSGAEITSDTLPEIEAVPSQMRQLFQNLIGNAIKFAKPGTRPRVHLGAKQLSATELASAGNFNAFSSVVQTASAANPKGGFLLLSIKDEGIGFDPAYADKVFEIFQRLHSGSEYGGTGIGLAICKRITDNHHGAISATSTPGNGATFYVLLPFTQSNFH